MFATRERWERFSLTLNSWPIQKMSRQRNQSRLGRKWFDRGPKPPKYNLANLCHTTWVHPCCWACCWKIFQQHALECCWVDKNVAESKKMLLKLGECCWKKKNVAEITAMLLKNFSATCSTRWVIYYYIYYFIYYFHYL